MFDASSSTLSRRSFLATGAVATGVAIASGGSGLLAQDEATPGGRPTSDQRIRLAVKFHMIQEDLSILDKFKLVKDLGYDGVEPRAWADNDRRQMLKASEATGIRIHGVVNSSRPDIVDAINLSKYFGASSVLVVAGRVNKENSYDKVYRETQELIRSAIPVAEKQGIRLLVENVWNNFLLSPLEMARYIDEFDSPAMGVYFDIGNVVRMGWPAHWIRILQHRVVKLDIKEYSREKQKNEGLWEGFNVEIGDGDSDWPEVRTALAEIGYTDGWGTAEVPGGDRRRLAEVAERMRNVLAIK
jgi:L-ribulose-5-phosphate 3-epimerase